MRFNDQSEDDESGRSFRWKIKGTLEGDQDSVPSESSSPKNNAQESFSNTSQQILFFRLLQQKSTEHLNTLSPFNKSQFKPQHMLKHMQIEGQPATSSMWLAKLSHHTHQSAKSPMRRGQAFERPHPPDSTKRQQPVAQTDPTLLQSSNSPKNYLNTHICIATTALIKLHSFYYGAASRKIRMSA